MSLRSISRQHELHIANLPFAPHDHVLRDILRDKFIRQVAEWLLGRDDTAILAQYGNSNWETALSVLFFIEADKIFSERNTEHDLRRQMRYKSIISAKWLLKNVIEIEVEHHNTMLCWEAVTWDTSVVIQALLAVLKHYPDSFSPAEKQNIINVVHNAAKWLYYRFNRWEEEVKYPFGPADIAQIVLAFIDIYEWGDLLDSVSTEIGGTNTGMKLIRSIVEYLLYSRDEEIIAFDAGNGQQKITAFMWSDFFNTAEVMYAIAKFYIFYSRNEKKSVERDSILKEIENAIIRTCLYLESSQVDGMWGTHVDTLRVLQAYVYVNKIIPRDMNVHNAANKTNVSLILPEIHTTFKALRWICDEKQIFSDGSFLHTLFLTVFYAHALIEIYSSWEPATKTVIEIYDDVLWYSPVRTTPERVKRLSAEIRANTLRQTIEQLSRDKVYLSNVLISSAVTMIMLLTIITVGNASGTLSFSVKLAIGPNFWEYMAISVSIVSAIITFIWKYRSKHGVK